MANRSLIFLPLAFVGLLIGCAAMTEPDTTQPLLDDAQTNYEFHTEKIVLGGYIDQHGYFTNKHFIKPFLRRHRNPVKRIGLQLVFTTSTFYKKTATATENKIAGEKLPKLPFEIVEHPDFGTLEVSELMRLANENWSTRGEWRSITSGGGKSTTQIHPTRKPNDKKPEQNENIERNILHTHTLYYTPTSKFKGLDKLVVKWPAFGRAKPKLIKYIITR